MSITTNEINTNSFTSSGLVKSNKINYKGFNLTKSWVSAGDSWTADPPNAGVTTFVDRIATKTNSTLIRAGVSGYRIAEYIGGATDAIEPWLNGTYDNTSTHIHLGLNDIRSSTQDQVKITFSDSLIEVYRAVLTTCLTMALPSSTIVSAQDYSAVNNASNWENSAFITNYGLNYVITGASTTDYVEYTLTGRYLFIYSYFTDNMTTGSRLEVLVNGTASGTIYGNIYASNFIATTNKVIARPLLLDMGVSGTYTVKITVFVQPDATTKVGIGYLAAFEENTKFKHVCIDTIPIFDWIRISSTAVNATTGWPDMDQLENRRRNCNDAIESVVRDLRYYNVPIFINYCNNASQSWVSDYFHPRPGFAELMANSFIKMALNEVVDNEEVDNENQGNVI